MAFNTYSIGRRERVAYGKETTFGSAVTPTEVVGYNATVEPSFNKNWQEVLSSGADGRDVEDYVEGINLFPFTLKFVVSSWKFLRHCGYDFTNTGSSPTIHTASIRNSIHSFTMQWVKIRAGTNVVYTLAGCFVKDATISWQKSSGPGMDGHIVVSLNCGAQSCTKGSTITSLSELSVTPFQFRMAKFTFDNTEVAECNNGTITISQGINEPDSIYANSTLSLNMGEPIPTIQRVNTRLNVNFKDATYYDAWAAGATVSNTKVEFIRTSSTDQAEFTFSGLKLAQELEPTNLEGVNNADLISNTTGFSSLEVLDNETW